MLGFKPLDEEGRVLYVEELSWSAPVFTDRREAGQILGRLLARSGLRVDAVFGLAAGGVPVALEAAAELGCCLDVVVVKKITYPWTTEAGFGAVALDGSYEYDPAGMAYAGYDRGQLEARVEELKGYVERRTLLVRGTTSYPRLEGRTVLLVDDGIATGYTMRVGVRFLRGLGAEHIYAAAPTASIDGARFVAEAADRVYVVNIRSGPYFAVADAYIEWHDVTDQELAALIDEARARKLLCPWLTPSTGHRAGGEHP